MTNYTAGNKEAWEEAFDNRSPEWGADITERVGREEYAFFVDDMKKTLRKYDLKGKDICQFCCNNGRELLSLVSTSGAASGTGFDIAENQILFAREKAEELGLPCNFTAVNIYELPDKYKDCFDFIFITIGALCWFKNLNEYFRILSGCLRKGGALVINEQHPFTNMIPDDEDERYNADTPVVVYPYFDYMWTNNCGMYYIAGKKYESKTFTDFTHPMSEIFSALLDNEIGICAFHEYDYDLGGGMDSMNGKGFPLSMVIEGKKL